MKPKNEAEMIKAQVLIRCPHCHGDAYQLVGDSEGFQVIDLLVITRANNVKVAVTNLCRSIWMNWPYSWFRYNTRTCS
jgi:hypothetical protein